jgi:hypothetical protein
MPSILDEQDTSLLDENPVTTGTLPAPVVLPPSTAPSILDDTLEANKESLLSKVKETYNKAAEWASTPKPLKEASVVGAVENIGKGAVGLGVGVTELVKLELGGLKEWITKPKESLMSLKQGPKIITEAVILPILADIKELFTHPIKYTYERPVSQMLNLAMIAGVGVGIKGVKEAGKVGRATAYMKEASTLIKAGETTAGKVALDAAKGTMGTLRKEGIRALSPKLEGLASELEYQRWLETYSPMSSRGVKSLGEVKVTPSRTITPINKAQQLGKFAKGVKGDKLKPITLEAFNQEQAPLALKEIGMKSQMVSKINQLQEELGQKITYTDKSGVERVSSGFRTKAYNENLKARGYSPAENSLHLEGMATDIPTKKLGLNQLEVAKAARKLGLDVEDLSLTPNHVHVELPKKGSPTKLHTFGEESKVATVTDQIRESAFANASEIIPEGQLDAMNYERYLRDKAAGPVSKPSKVVINPEYQGDYHSLKPSVASLGKAIGDTPNETAAIANHWMENLYAMKHPEHGQSFVAKNYKPQGEIPKFPERIYPWIKTKTKAPMPTGESNAFSRKVGSPGQVMRDSWGLENPLVDAFEAGQTAGLNTENSFKWFKSISKGVKSDSKMVKDRMNPFVKEHVALSRKFEMTTDESMKKSLSDMIIKNYKDANDFQLKIAESSPDVRIAMYAEDTLPATMLSRMSEKEIQVGEMIKSYYTKTADDMKRVGMPIVSKQAYTRHIISQEMKEALGNYNNIPDSIKKHIPADMAFAHRAGEFNWFPSMTAQLTDYIPVVERKLAFQPYLIHWKDTVDKAAKMGNKAGIEAAEMIKNNIYRGGTLSDKISSGITSTNYFLQLFMNARVAVKHVIGGFPGAISEVGIWNTPQAVYQMVAHPLKSQEMLKTFGKLKDIVKTLETTSGIEVHSSRLLKALQGQPTVMAEYVESGINIMGNLMKGGSKGIDPELLRSYIWNKVTSVNFRGGWDIPKVFANPAGRIAFQYSLEPHKVWEYRLELVKRAMAGEKDIYGTSYGSKLIQYIGMVGASEAMARAHGKTIMDTIGGTPYIDFVSPKKGFPFVKPQMKVKLGPGVKLIADVSKDIARGDVLHVADEFVNYGLESGVGLLGQLSKAAGGKIPDYYEDAYDYLLGLPELDRLEKMNSKVTKYMKFRTEKDELFRERGLIKKNPVLKNFVLYKRDFRKQLRAFLDNPDKHFQGAYGKPTQGSILDEQE